MKLSRPSSSCGVSQSREIGGWRDGPGFVCQVEPESRHAPIAINSDSPGRGMQMADEPKAPVPMSSEPVQTLHIPYESARRLARLPRTKSYIETTAAAFGGTIAALPSATNAVRHALNRNTFGLEIFEIVQVLICFGCLAWLIVSLMHSRQEKTSVEYLDELRRPSSPGPAWPAPPTLS